MRLLSNHAARRWVERFPGVPCTDALIDECEVLDWGTLMRWMFRLPQRMRMSTRRNLTHLYHHEHRMFLVFDPITELMVTVLKLEDGHGEP